MAEQNARTSTSQDELPFGAIAPPAATGNRAKRGDGRDAERRSSAESDRAASDADGRERGKDGGREGGKGTKDWRRAENRRGGGRRGGRRRGRRGGDGGGAGTGAVERDAGEPAAGAGDGTDVDGQVSARDDRGGQAVREHGTRGRRRRKGRRGRGRDGAQGGGTAVDSKGPRGGPSQPAQGQQGPKGDDARTTPVEETGMFAVDKGGFGFLRRLEHHYLPRKDDPFVPKAMLSRWKLREGALVTGKVGRGHGQYKRAVTEILSVDGKPPQQTLNTPAFKNLTSIDPDFHYALGNATQDVNMRIVDVICPVGRGTRGLIVAPPRSGKTILLQKFAKGIEEHYPDVKLFVLLVDERPEEATEWTRSIGSHVFVSTNDESPKNHVQLAEAVWKRCQRLVELGEDVVLLLDSITRLARAYNNFQAGSGRTMSGGLDTRTMEKPKQFFGSARNTETAGSLTILGTTLVETGSRMDQVIFEEFKGTGNMELVLSRKLADRRIFPAIDIERSGTRKEEKLISSKQLKRIHTLRRVLAKMNFIEAMELLITKLDDVETNEEFLQRFDVDPDA